MENDPSLGRVGSASLGVINTGLERFSDMERRRFLHGAAGVVGSLMLEGIGALSVLSRAHNEATLEDVGDLALIPQGDACAYTPPCEIEQTIIAPADNEAIVVHLEPEPTATTTSTTVPPPPTTTPPPPTSAPIEQIAVESQAAVRAELLDLPKRRMPFAEFAANKETMIGRLPGLDTLGRHWGNSHFYGNSEQQKQHIEFLNQSVELSIEEYRAFNQTLNADYKETFATDGIITPQMVVWHWTGKHYDNVEHFIKSIKNHRGLGVQAYVHGDGSAYQLTPTLSHKAYHALRMEDFAVGIEIYSGDYDPINGPSPLFSYTPATVKSGLYMAMKMFEELQLPINEYTFLSHHSGDLLFVNPYYDPYSGEFRTQEGYKPPQVRKHDVVQDMMYMLLPKLQKLQAELQAA